MGDVTTGGIDDDSRGKRKPKADAARPPASGEARRIAVPRPNFVVAEYRLRGTAPLVQCKFPEKAKHKIAEQHELGSQAKKAGKKREARDFVADFEAAAHRGPDGSYGIPAAAFRAAMIDACRKVDFKMTHAKMSVFVEADFLDGEEGTPLVRLEAGEPEFSRMPVRNATGVVDLRARPMWREWGCTLRVRFDGNQFTAEDVANLLTWAGTCIGVGEGRPFSKNSNGMGWGTFAHAEDDR